MSDAIATLSINGQHIELPILQSTLGYPVVDIASLAKAELFTFDPGFFATAACESTITYIDGDKGMLLYRGYPIEALAQKKNFSEVVYLLVHGELADSATQKTFEKTLSDHAHIDEILQNTLQGFSKDAHPMAMLSALTSALAGKYHKEIDLEDKSSRYHAACLAIAKIPTLCALTYRHQQDLAPIQPRSDFNYAENFLHMLFAENDDSPRPNPVLSQALDRIFTLHADHEQNASTSTVRLAGSTGTDLFAALTAGIAALWGPAHGGANEAALNMLREIGDESQIERYIAKAKDKNDPFRLMGFGHRVYKNYDPRAIVMRETCHDVLNELGSHNSSTLKIALKLEKIALEDPYFIERKLYPNIDFYSGITLDAIGIPSSLFTVIFALARTTGWVAHWLEMLADPKHRIGRPRQRYTGEKERELP
jgi:citrate synthase